MCSPACYFGSSSSRDGAGGKESTEFPLSLCHALRHYLPWHATVERMTSIRRQFTGGACSPFARCRTSGETTVEWAINLLNEFACETKGEQWERERQRERGIHSKPNKNKPNLLYTWNCALRVLEWALGVERERERERERQNRICVFRCSII